MSNIGPLTVTQYYIRVGNGEQWLNQRYCLMDCWSVLACTAIGVIVQLFVCNAEFVFHFIVIFYRFIVLSWNNSHCLCTTHLPSLSVPQPYMSLGRHRWHEAAERTVLCLHWAVLEWPGQSDCCTCALATQSFLLAFSSSRRLPSSAPRKWKGDLHDGLPVCCVLPFDTPNTPSAPPTPPPAVVIITSLLRPLPHHFSINHRHSVHRHWNTLLLLINYNHN